MPAGSSPAAQAQSLLASSDAALFGGFAGSGSDLPDLSGLTGAAQAYSLYTDPALVQLLASGPANASTAASGSGSSRVAAVGDAARVRVQPVRRGLVVDELVGRNGRLRPPEAIAQARRFLISAAVATTRATPPSTIATMAERARVVVLRGGDDGRAARRRSAGGRGHRTSGLLRCGELQDRRGVLGRGPARGDRVDPAHDGAVGVGLYRSEHELRGVGRRCRRR